MRRLLALLVLFAVPCWATTYYVKNGGSDGAAGTSDGTAWATISKVNGVTFAAGDSILFKKGSLWRGTTLTPHNSGSAGSVITYGAYDSGNMPIITMGVLLTGWTNSSGNVWYATLASNPGWVFMDGNIGDYKTATGGLVNEYDFFWDSGASRLYVYAATSPDTRYTNPGVEYRGGKALDPVQSYITINGICFEKSDYATIHANNPGSHWIVQNCLLRYSDRGLELGGGAAYSEWDIRDNEVAYCNMIGLGPGWAGTNVRIYRNNVHHIDTLTMFVPGPAGSSWTGGIKFYAETITNGMAGADIYQNYLHDMGRGTLDDGVGHGTAIWIDTVNPGVGTPITIHHNWMQDCTGGGIFIEISSNTHSYGNVVWNCGTCPTTGTDIWACAGIQINCRTGYVSENNLVYNNTIYGGVQGILCGTYSSAANIINNNVFKNNIAIGQTAQALCALTGGDNVTYGSGNVYQYNCFGAQATNFIRWGYPGLKSTYAAWEASTGVILDGGTTHSINADPTLTNPTSGVFTLQASSPCIDVGVNLGSTYQDGLLAASTWPSGVVTGAQGSYGTGWEIGAYIYQSAGSPYVLIVGALFSLIPAIAVGRRGR